LFEFEVIRIADQLGARSYRFPALISPAYMERVQYFKNFPHSLTFATHLRENVELIDRFSSTARVGEDGRISAERDLYASAPAMLSPTICHHLYLSLAGRTLPRGGLVATASGNCFRFESKNMVSLERLWNFTMRELVFVGSESYVRRALEDLRQRIDGVLRRFELSHDIMTANDPFFIGTFRDQAAYQAAFELKHEVRALLPFKNDTVAMASFNRHGDFFGKTLDIRCEDGTPAHTGCFGVGFERMAFAFVSQHSVDPEVWPEAVRAARRPTEHIRF
jgi:seryl-tRNA synthetase